MELNPTNLRDLEFICEAARLHFEATACMPAWVERSDKYRRIFVEEFEKQQKEETERRNSQ
jgi:hypothetical protein